MDKKDSVNFTLQTFQNPDSSYGYDIYQDSVKMIHQPHIPVLQGNRGFVSEIDAKRVGDLVIRKLNKGEIPPTIDSAEIITIIK
ncbi:MAG: DUF4907 domain-containing protein [Bacteroidetes bacterium]|nr:DUF4907 domain-containing protein [Bacteroidota bacterium]